MQQSQIPGLGLRTAADIDDAAGGKPCRGGQKFRGAAAAGRVHHQEIQREIILSGGLHPGGSVCGNKADVFDPIQSGVAHGVPHGGGILFHPDDLSGPLGGKDADGADAAVGVQHPFPAGQSGGLDGAPVQHFGLGGIDLVERAGREAESFAAKGIADRTGTIQDLFPVTQQNAGFTAVDILYDGGDLRMFPQQCLDEVGAGGKNGGGGDQHHHDLPGVNAAAYQHVPQKAGAGVLIVGEQPKARQQPADGDDNGGRDLVLIQAAVNIDDTVAALLVGARDDASGAVQAKGRLHLIAVVAGVVGTQDGQDPAEPGKMPLYKFLLIVQLLLVGHVKQLAAAAAGKIRTAQFIHGGESPFWAGWTGEAPRQQDSAQGLQVSGISRGDGITGKKFPDRDGQAAGEQRRVSRQLHAVALHLPLDVGKDMGGRPQRGNGGKRSRKQLGNLGGSMLPRQGGKFPQRGQESPGGALGDLYFAGPAEQQDGFVLPAAASFFLAGGQ